MSAIAVAVVASILALTLGALAAVALGLVRRVKTLMADVQAMQARLAPSLDELGREAAVTERELSRLGEVAGELRRS